jgi:hypothetical protein
MGLGVIADPVAADYDVVERNVENSLVQVNVTDLQRAQFAPAARQ